MSAILILSAILGAPVQAADGGPNVGFGTGWIWMDPNENLEDTWSVVPRLGYGIGRVVTIEAEVGLSQGHTRGWGYGYQSASPRANFVLNMAPQAPIEPFILGGAGFVHQKVRRSVDSWSTEPLSGEDLGNYINPDTDALINGGLGVFIPLGGAMALRIDGRAIYTFGQEPHGAQADQFLDLEATAGVAFRGQELKIDTDGDRIVDVHDTCPNKAEDWDGFEDADGCPDLDNDSDGVADAQDDCPNKAEDMDNWLDSDGCPERDNDLDGLSDHEDACPLDREDMDGFHDEDGCPDLDNDTDGVPDVQDACPNHPEDLDGYRDEDGCPEEDNDADGLVDAQDACPDVSETYNGFEDADGCPDELPADLQRFVGVIRGVNFAIDQDRITVSSYQILNEAADVLKRHTDLRLEVQGHTDADGGEEHNLELSTARARSVVRYLVSKGVDKERLEWTGFGEGQPLVTNDSGEGKAINRRVEFRILDDALTDSKG
jgi:outer membrane protein OmpA-like peptidoglycan-associated protein